MRNKVRFLLGIGLVWIEVGLLLSATASGQDDRPFVEYPAKQADYLLRLHAKDAAQGLRGELAFRADYPGGFAAWQSVARAKLADLLGLKRMKSELDHPSARFADPILEDGYTRRRGELETEPGIFIPFWLLTPTTGKNIEKRPLVICAHGHDADGWNSYAGVYRDDKHRQQTLEKDGDIGVQAVKRGFVALVPATRGLAQVASLPDPKGRHGNRPCRAQLIHCLLAGRTAVGERVWDTQRLLDWALSEIKGIDHSKVVMLGNSGGGVLTVYAAALDERIAVAVPSCSFTSFTSSTGFVFHCDCCLVPSAEVVLGDMSDIGALTAPRALLAVHGRKDGLHSFADVERAMKRVRSIYKAANATDRFHHEWGADGHKFYPNIMWPFIEAQLAK
ncbi:MAG TPA: hypothetical protein EYQ75_25320 [Planctomycetaceae bacterium]|nr:hypothetical protein [Planctomycetaceae bacterium]